MKLINCKKNYMAKIIKTITGEAAFVLEETFESEDKATEGTEPLTQEVTDIEIKINNTKWKKPNEWYTA